jgi:hypothetical protein
LSDNISYIFDERDDGVTIKDRQIDRNEVLLQPGEEPAHTCKHLFGLEDEYLKEEICRSVKSPKCPAASRFRLKEDQSQFSDRSAAYKRSNFIYSKQLFIRRLLTAAQKAKALMRVYSTIDHIRDVDSVVL